MATITEDRMVVEDFYVIPVQFDTRCNHPHYLYLKKHVTRENDEAKPKDRTLFIVNVPPYATEESLRRVFSSCGKVLKVFLHEKPTKGEPPQEKSKFFPVHRPPQGFKVAYIVFKQSNSVDKALNLPYSKPLILSTSDAPIVTGIAKWKREYVDRTSIDISEMKREIDEFMSDFDKLTAEKEKKAKEMEGQADDEGWITVTRVGKNKGAPRTEAEAKRVTSKDKKRRKEKELINFYSFQVRESKKQEIMELRRKFEEDKQKIALMKAARKFRPY
ncbi:ribosomal RNA-processing protein 7 homolog A-like [Pomacea canaliculata]|uniref:ribosomal RNA-processing protein 7 homolog A-like n=1 Tax=Pomacea canaliculata TaxID=400727 RepID=UPI000D725E19|nr:ribosomal RNA-processing protein 7 homolog A-like [Pomacea canaliculata]